MFLYGVFYNQGLTLSHDRVMLVWSVTPRKHSIVQVHPESEAGTEKLKPHFSRGLEQPPPLLRIQYANLSTIVEVLLILLKHFKT